MIMTITHIDSVDINSLNWGSDSKESEQCATPSDIGSRIIILLQSWEVTEVIFIVDPTIG